ncbi:hypothetical protein [Streptomyces sp. TRM49041]|uniref:hypothetical protein n=1 Tax=Streptomyces sp. TRM49041 TaxID=2603216 RepID=UPI0011F08EF4|nr:hypothetical protein [Streptomyces sp. TRM49041]
MDSSTPQWALRQYGDDADAIGVAAWKALEDTEEAVLDVRAVARSKHGFASGGARMTNQYERLIEHILDLGIEGTEIVKTGSWYRLPLVHDTVLFPVCAEVDGTEPPSHWPRGRDLSKLVQEIFAATSPEAKFWISDPIPGLDVAELVLRPSLAELAARDPRPELVLVWYEMNRSGLKRAWWGKAELLDESGNLRWLTERSLLTAPERTPLFAIPDRDADDRFDSGDLPEVPMTGRSDEERKLGTPPTTEVAEATEEDSAESDEG